MTLRSQVFQMQPHLSSNFLMSRVQSRTTLNKMDFYAELMLQEGRHY